MAAGGILDSLTSNTATNGRPYLFFLPTKIWFFLLSKLFPPKWQVISMVLHWVLVWITPSDTDNADLFLLREMVFSLCFHNTNSSQFPPTSLAALLFGLLCLLPFFLSYSPLQAPPQTSLFLPLSQEFPFSLHDSKRHPDASASLTHLPSYFLSQMQTHKAKRLHWDAVLIEPDLPILFPLRLLLLQTPHPSGGSNHPPVSQPRLSDSSSSLCSPLALKPAMLKLVMYAPKYLSNLAAGVPSSHSLFSL